MGCFYSFTFAVWLINPQCMHKGYSRIEMHYKEYWICSGCSRQVLIRMLWGIDGYRVAVLDRFY